jgi:hypothetical protein
VCVAGRWTPPRDIGRGRAPPAADEEGAEKLGGGGRAVLRTSALLAFLVMRCGAIGVGSAEIDARALRLAGATPTVGARSERVGACSRFGFGRMNCRTGRDGAWGMESVRAWK